MNSRYFDAATSLTNTIFQDILNIKDLRLMDEMAEEFKKVRLDFFNILARLEEAATHSQSPTLPDAHIYATYDADKDELVIKEKSVEQYCNQCKGVPLANFHHEIMNRATDLLKCFLKHEGKFVTTEVWFRDVQIDEYTIGKFTVTLV